MEWVGLVLGWFGVLVWGRGHIEWGVGGEEPGRRELGGSCGGGSWLVGGGVVVTGESVGRR